MITLTSKLKFPMSNRAFAQVCILIILMSVFAYFGGEAVINLSLEYRISNLENLTEDMRRLTIEQVLNSSFYPMQKPCSYLVSKVGTYTCMQDGSDGKLKWYDTDSSAVINAALGNLTSGGKIFIKGTHTITNALSIGYSNISIFGEGKNSRLETNGTTNIISATSKTGLQISDLYFKGIGGTYGWNANKNAIHFEYCNNSVVRNCFFENISSVAIRFYKSMYCQAFDNEFETVFYGVDSTFTVQTSSYNIISGNIGKDIRSSGGPPIGGHLIKSYLSDHNTICHNIANVCDGSAINLEFSSHCDVSNNILVGAREGVQVETGDYNNIEGNIITNATTLGVILAGSDYNQVSLNQIYNAGTQGIKLSHSDYNIVTNNLVDGSGSGNIRLNGWVDNGNHCNNNSIAFNTVINSLYGLKLENDADDNLIESNIFLDNTDSIILGGAGNLYKDNVGFVTENSGTATDKANGGTIAHGLAGTPTTVTLTSLNAIYDRVGVIVAWDKPNTNSTNISLDIYWTNGTAITDGVIDVSWYAEYEP